MESWRVVWREAFAPLASIDGLFSLALALRADDPRLIQGNTTTPPPLMCVQDWPVEGADAIGWLGWQGGKGPAKTVGEVEEFFARACFEADQKLGEPVACRWFLNWFDETPRGEMRSSLYGEVITELTKRSKVDVDPPLYKAALKNWDDKTISLAVADWLQEHDDPAHEAIWRASSTPWVGNIEEPIIFPAVLRS